MTAGILPPTIILSRFATLLPHGYPFSYILRRLHDLALMYPRFHLCDLQDQIRVADIIEPVENLTTRDRIILCASPANSKDPRVPHVCKTFALCVANKRGGALLELSCLNLGILEAGATVAKRYLAELEFLHWSLVLYLWLSYRFDGVFTSQEMAIYVKGLVEAKIDKVLGEFSVRSGRRRSWHKDSTAKDDQDQTLSFDPNQSLDDGSTQSLAGEIDTLNCILDEKPHDSRIRVRA